MKKIFITGGHLSPALAVIDVLKKRGDWRIYFVGRKYQQEGKNILSTEYTLLRNSPNIIFLTLTTGRLQRSITRYTLPSLLKLPVGFAQSSYFLLRYQPDVVLSFGGYLALPVATVAWLLGTPIVTHEQTTVTGVANRIIAQMAKKVLLSFPDDRARFDPDKYMISGLPVRQEIFAPQNTARYLAFNKIRRKYFHQKVIYVTGGNQGSQSINNLVKDSLNQLLENYLVIHSTGVGDYEKLMAVAKNLSMAEKYFPFNFIGAGDIGWVYKSSDIVVGRSGASTIYELAALGKVAILIPLPWSGGGEQKRNAQIMAEFGGSIVLNQDAVGPDSLLDSLRYLSKNFKQFSQKAKTASSLIKPQAAQTIVSELEKILTD